MGEEALISGAEIVEAFLAVRCAKKAILRATAVAHGEDLAGLAETWQPFRFGLSEFPLRRAVQQISQGSLAIFPRQCSSSTK